MHLVMVKKTLLKLHHLFAQSFPQLVSVSVDGIQQNVSRVLPFVIKERIILEPHKVEDIQVVFAPRQAGIYIGQLHLQVATISGALPQGHYVPTMVTLQAVAKPPDVKVRGNNVYTQ